MKWKTRTLPETTDYRLVLNTDTEVLKELQRITDQVDYEDIVRLAFEKLLYLKDSSMLYDFVKWAATESSEVSDLKLLLTQVLAVSRYIDTDYRWIVMDLSYDSFFLNTYEITHVDIDYERECLVLSFKDIEH